MVTISGTAITTFQKKRNIIVNHLELVRHRIMGNKYFGITNLMQTKHVNIK
jgi:hypothetical protein